MFRRFSISLCLALALVLVASTSIYAAGINHGDFTLNTTEIERLKSLGFSEEQLDLMTLEEHEALISKIGASTRGEIVGVETSYYRVSTEDGVTEISKEQADEELLEYESRVTAFASDTATTSWMRMTTTSSSLGQGEYYLMNSFRWLTRPVYALTDVVGMSFNPNLTYIQDSEYASYTREYGGVNPPSPELDHLFYAQHKSANAGIAFDIDLKLYSNNGYRMTETHSGYMSFRVRKNNTTATSTNVYGHYSHLYNTINFDVSFPAGMAISGLTQHDDMDDTGISFNF